MVRRNIAICLAIIIFAVAGFVIMFNYGNPLSEMWAKNAAKERIAKKYPKKDFYITGVFYNKEKDSYDVDIASSSSEDSYFTMSFDRKGKFIKENYDNITDKKNTVVRLDGKYQEKLQKALADDKNVSYYFENCLADFIMDTDKFETYEKEMKKHAAKQSSLVIDKKYDVSSMGKKHGHIVVTAVYKETSNKGIGKLLLKIKEHLDKKNFGFKFKDLSIIDDTAGGEKDDGKTLNLYCIPYEKIKKKGIEDVVKKAAKIASKEDAEEIDEGEDQEEAEVEEFVD